MLEQLEQLGMLEQLGKVGMLEQLGMLAMLEYSGFLKENSEVFGKFTYTGKKY